jgi:hypothetical protein
MKAPLSARARQIISNADTSKQLMNFLVFNTHRFGTPYKAPTFKVKDATGKNVDVTPSFGKPAAPAAVSR